jgi:hypothetical protein
MVVAHIVIVTITEVTVTLADEPDIYFRETWFNFEISLLDIAF